MSNQNNDTEMSMDEILASIKRYVADDVPETNLSDIEHHTGHTADVIKLTEAVDQEKPKTQAEFTPFAKIENIEPKRDHYQSHDSASYINAKTTSFRMPEQAAQPQPIIPPAPINHHYQQSNTMQQQQYYQNKGFQEASAQYQQESTAPIHHAAGVISEQATHATAQAFSKLTEAFQSAKSEKEAAAPKVPSMSAIESFVIEMSRPMIRQWIDENLANLVNKLVAQEIEKLTDDLRKKLL